MTMDRNRPTPTGFDLFLDNIRELRWHRYGYWIGICPQCGSDWLQVFELDLEARCRRCHLNSFGLEEFQKKFLGNSQEAPPRKEVLPTRGNCEICGAEFEILPYTRRRKQYCGGRCQKRAERQRKKGGKE